MFNKTKTRLIMLNCLVFFVILASCGLILYTYLRHQLYDKVDASIMERAVDFNSNMGSKAVFFFGPQNEKELPVMPSQTRLQVRVLDPRVFVILWDKDGKPIPLTPLKGKEQEVLTQFGSYTSAHKPQTVTISGHYYRLVTLTYVKPQLININPLMEGDHFPDGQAFRQGGVSGPVNTVPLPREIQSIQTISSVDSEQNMLQTLIRVMLIGSVFGLAIIFLTGRYLAGQALLPIRRSWDKQQQFVADASHELRMPLSIILANAELVFRHPDRTILEMSESLSMVLSESKRMAKLTEQLLTLARSDSNIEEIVIQPIVLNHIIRDVIQKFTPIAEMNEVQIKEQISLPLEMQGDRDRLHQLLVILMDNSIKHTPSGGIIRVSAYKNGNEAVMIVEDTGSGIGPDDLPHIFDRFFRGDKIRNHSEGGTGLGLAIAKWIVEKHGGTITAQSTLGAGTKMMIHLPAKVKG